MHKREPVAFLSYVRSDDDHDQGNITRLRERLEGELKVQLGKNFAIFQDRNDIKWGQQWQARIEKSIIDVTFLIPVVTPSFFYSPACRDEFNAFFLKEKQYGFNHLILPLYYVDCDQLEQDFPAGKDAMADALRSRQWFDWRPFRFRQLLDAEVALTLAKMAREIKRAMVALEVQLDAEIASREDPPAIKPRTKKSARRGVVASSADLTADLVIPTEPYSFEIMSVRDGDERFDRHRLDALRSRPYYVYTKKFDEIVRPEELANLDELVRLQQFLNKHLAMYTLSEAVEAQKFPSKSAVTLLLDNSGSFRGRPIMSLAACVTLLMEWLENKHALVEVLGFTTRAWKGGQSREMWITDGKPSQPGRLNDLRHIIYKRFDEPVRQISGNLGIMMREGILKENVDGEALLWAYSRIIKQDAKNRLIVIFSDGAAVDDSTLSVNRPNILNDHLIFSMNYVKDHGVKLLIIEPDITTRDKEKSYEYREFGGMAKSVDKMAEAILASIN